MMPSHKSLRNIHKGFKHNEDWAQGTGSDLFDLDGEILDSGANLSLPSPRQVHRNHGDDTCNQESEIAAIGAGTKADLDEFLL